MKKQTRNTTSGLYAFLEYSGVLANGSKEDIEKQKKLYWNKYKREYKKRKRKTHRPFEILLDQREYDFVSNAAKKLRTSITNYIKISALRDNETALITPAIIGEFREALYLNYTAVENCIEESKMTESFGNNLLGKLTSIEKQFIDLIGRRRVR